MFKFKHEEKKASLIQGPICDQLNVFNQPSPKWVEGNEHQVANDSPGGCIMAGIGSIPAISW